MRGFGWVVLAAVLCGLVWSLHAYAQYEADVVAGAQIQRVKDCTTYPHPTFLRAKNCSYLNGGTGPLGVETRP